MKCQACKQISNNGETYKFFVVNVGETTRTKTGFKEYTYTTPYQVVGEEADFICRNCYLKSLLISDVGLIMIAVPVISVFFQLSDTFFESLVMGIIGGVLFLGLDIVISGWKYFFEKYGDRVLIRVWRKKPEYKNYELYDRAKAVSIGLKGRYRY